MKKRHRKHKPLFAFPDYFEVRYLHNINGKMVCFGTSSSGAERKRSSTRITFANDFRSRHWNEKVATGATEEKFKQLPGAV